MEGGGKGPRLCCGLVAHDALDNNNIFFLSRLGELSLCDEMAGVSELPSINVSYHSVHVISQAIAVQRSQHWKGSLNRQAAAVFRPSSIASHPLC